jgi:hypothetical protein
MLARETFDSPHVWHNRSTFLLDAQKGRTSHPPTPARQDAPLADFFSIRLGFFLAC